jgi:hypothetical protein
VANPIAVVNEAHNVALRIQGWMLKSIGYDVYAAGESFRKIVPNYHYSGQILPEILGVMERKDMPQDALFLDTHPGSIPALRATGWSGPILVVWYMPVGPEWISQNFRVMGKVGSLAWSAAVGRFFREWSVCPNDGFWPPYYGNIDTTPRETVGDYLITAIENAAGWSNVPVLEQLRDDPHAKLELYGGAPPAWSRKIPQKEFFARLRGCRAMYHLKPFDTPGFAVMEAALSGVPIIFPPDWMKSTETKFFIEGDSCLIVPTQKEAVLEAVKRLSDRTENLRMGRAGQKVVQIEIDWKVNAPRFKALIDAVRRMP